MSKKPQKAENPKVKPQTVDQQNEPFLRALQKKVRNINKKLTEIGELQGKDNLKPQQVQKISRKEALIEERTKVQENATFFKQIYTENVAHYRNNQLKELQILARAISVYHTAPQFAEHAKLSALWQAIQKQSHPNLNAAIISLSTVLKDFANDRKLQKSLTNFTEKHGNDEIKPAEITKEKVVNDTLEEKPPKQETKVQEVQAKVEVTPQVQAPAPVIQSKPEPVVEKAPEAPQVVVEQQATPIIQEPIVSTTQQQSVEAPKQGQKRDYKNRDNKDKPYRGKGNYRGNNNREGEKRQYKPKFEEKKEEQRQRNESDDSESSEEARQFRREEIKKLQDDGFIVVGKPKPKPKDTHEQQRAHEKQHGKKYHHHHQAGNH